MNEEQLLEYYNGLDYVQRQIWIKTKQHLNLMDYRQSSG